MNETEKRINTLFDKLVPDSGKADMVAGEIIRAISHIGCRNWNDGDHLGIGYGRETVNPAARYLAAKCDSRVTSTLAAAWALMTTMLTTRSWKQSSFTWTHIWNWRQKPTARICGITRTRTKTGMAMINTGGKKVKEACRHECKEHRIRSCCVEKI